MILKNKIIASILTGTILFQTVLPLTTLANTSTVEGEGTNAGTEITSTSITFIDNNLYQAIVEILGDKISEKNDETKSLTITNENLATVESLDLSNKNISSLSGIEAFSNLKELIAYQNNITDIAGIENLANLQVLDLSKNKIEEFPELAGITDENLKVENQNYTDLAIQSQANIAEIDLPQTFIQAQNSNSRYYSEEGFEFGNCELNEEKTKLVIDVDLVSKTNAMIKIKSGELAGTVLLVYGLGITYNIDITEIKLMDINIDLNEDGDITLADAELVRTYIDNKEQLTQNQITKVEQLDVNYDGKISEIDYNRFLKYVNGNSQILFLGGIDTTYKINENVIAQVQTLSPDYELNDEMYIFTQNGEHEFTVVDKKGNQQVLLATVNCIDKEQPIYEILYSTQEVTNKGVTVTITANEELVDIYGDYENQYGEIISTGWTLSENKMTIQKTYTENKEETVELLDLAGNITQVEVSINNIVTNAPDSGNLIIKEENSQGNDYENNTWTNKNVYIAIDEQNRPENTTMYYQINGQGQYTESQVLQEDGEYTITLITTDLAGNKTTTNYVVKIDKTAPTNGALHIKLESSIGDELENGATTNHNVYVGIDNGEDNLSGIDKVYYILNGETEVQDSQIYYQTGNYQMKLVIVDKAGNVKEAEYSFTIDKEEAILNTEYVVNTDGSVTAKIISNKQLQELEGWTLSTDRLTLSKIYNVNKTESLTVTDLAGNTSNVTIQITGVSVKIFMVDIDYSTKDITKQNVIVTITSTLPMKQLEGWTLDSSECVQTKEFTNNTAQTIIVESKDGVTTEEEIKITNIDKQLPLIRVNYSIQQNTNKDVVVKIVSNEELQALNGWVLSTDKMTLQKSYSQNTDETITVKDLAGNEAQATIKITNIDKTAPSVNVTYSTEQETYGEVTVTITSNEQLKALDGWTLSNDKLKLSKTFNKNVVKTVVIEDLVGNTTNVKIDIQNIKEKQELSTNVYEITEDNYILGIKPNTIVNDCLKNLGITKELSDTEIVKTGMTLKANDIIYTLIVVGDINKDGESDIIDLSNLIAHTANISGNKLTGDSLKAADINLDKTVDLRDLSKMCLQIANLDNN